MYALTLAEDGRVQSVCEVLPKTPMSMPRVNTVPDGDYNDYLYLDGKFVHDPLPPQPAPEPQPSEDDRRDAQIAYTAMMTDTLLPETAQNKEATNV